MAWLRSTLLLVLPAAGCAGQSVEGAWVGPFPLEGARACEMRLKGDRSMEMECDGTAIVGGGEYRWDGSELEVVFEVLTYQGKKVQNPAPFIFKVEGRGNGLKAAYGGKVFEWRRKMR